MIKIYRRCSNLLNLNEKILNVNYGRLLYHNTKILYFDRDKFLLKQNITRFKNILKSTSLEVTYARNVLRNSEAYTNCLADSLIKKTDINITDVQELIKKEWIIMPNEELLNNFEILSCYVNKKKNELISNDKYKTLVNVLSVKCKYFNNKELMHLLNCLELWPLNQNNNLCSKMIKILQIIDQEYCNRLPSLSVDDIFLINDYFCKVNFLGMSNFMNMSLTTLNFNKLSFTNLVQLMFFMKVERNLKIPLPTIEQHLWKYYDKFTIEELGIISMAFFKHECKIQDKQILLKIMNKLQNNLNVVDDVTLIAILKTLR